MSTDIARTQDIKLVVSGGATLPSVRPLEALELEINSALKASETILDEGTTAQLRAAAKRLEAFDLEDLRCRLDAAMRPATVDEINVLCARLCAGYPTKNRDPLFSVILAEEVGAVDVSVAELETSVRHLLRNEKFLPSIAEVLEALGHAEWHLKDKRQKLEKIPQRLLELPKRIALMEQRECERERDEVDACYRRMSNGKDLHGAYPSEIMAKAQARLDAENAAAAASRTDTDDGSDVPF
jgi:hypothetical protein